MNAREVRWRESEQQALQLSRLNTYGLARTLTGYYYIAHYLPLLAMSSVDEELAVARIEELSGASFETYLHFPFCEVLCSFCHFYKEIRRHRSDAEQEKFISLLRKEMLLYKGILGKINARSVYIGGGTPSLLSNHLLINLLETVDECMTILPGAEIKFEIYPKDFGKTELREKIKILRDYGFTDIVVDLESGNKNCLDAVGRRNSSLHSYLTVIDELSTAGFDSIVTALVVGLPFETFDTLGQTVEILAQRPEVKVVNTFPLIIKRTDPMYQKLVRQPGVFPSAQQRDALWIFARNELRRQGFEEGPISYLSRRGKRPKQQAEKFECVNLLGFGPSAFGYWNGRDHASQHFNFCNLNDYSRALDRGSIPLWQAGLLDNEERARRKLIFGLANCRTENLSNIERSYGISVDMVFGQILNALLELELIYIDPLGGGIAYTEAGLCRLEEVSFFLSSNYVKDRVSLSPGKLRHNRELSAHHYFIRVPKTHRRTFERFASIQPADFMHRLSLEIPCRSLSLSY